MLKRWLLLLMLISYKVYALDNNIYLTYSDWSDWQETKIEETPLIEVQVEKKYRWYMEDRIDGDYYIENENDPSFPLIDRVIISKLPFQNLLTINLICCQIE